MKYTVNGRTGEYCVEVFPTLYNSTSMLCTEGINDFPHPCISSRTNHAAVNLSSTHVGGRIKKTKNVENVEKNIICPFTARFTLIISSRGKPRLLPVHFNPT